MDNQPGGVIDPHCSRSSEALLCFSTAGEAWQVHWGRFDEFGTAAYWVNQAVEGQYTERVMAKAESSDLLPTILFCLLSGNQVKAETARFAQRAVLNLLESNPIPSMEQVEEVLLALPFPGGTGRYRYPHKGAREVAGAIRRFQNQPPPDNPLLLRAWLEGLDGVGRKKSAHILRNAVGAEVAIVDIHLVKALTPIGIYRREWRLPRNYRRYEDVYMQYAAYGKVHAGALDLCIWEIVREAGAHRFPSDK